MRRRATLSPALLALLAFVCGLAARPAGAQSGQTIYADALQNGWQNWSWSVTDLNSADYVHAGSHSVKITYAAAWQGFYLHHPAFNTTPYTSLTFWINGGTANGRSINVQALLNDNAQAPVSLNSYLSGGSVAAKAWRQVTIPLAALGVANAAAMTGFWLQDSSGAPQPAFYVDDIALTGLPAPSVVHLSADAGHFVRTVDSRVFGVNTAIWDSALNTPGTITLLQESGTHVLRFPGGSSSDSYHWQTNRSDGDTFQWASSFDAFANVAKSIGAQAFITTNYGSGTAQEAADWVTYANVTRGYRFRYWEIGNENYGTWENDTHTVKNDPYTYATAAKDYIAKMKAADGSVKVGVVVVTGEDSFVNNTNHPATNPRTGQTHNGWTPVLLTTLKKLGVTPNFVIYHRYEQGPGGESDEALLQSARTWPNDAADLRHQLSDYLGAAGANVEIVCTENNSVYSNPGKQTTSLVNGLFLADSVGNILQTELNALVWWDLRNGQEAGNNNSSELYGWRQYGDYGLLSASNDLYPTYYIGKLLSRFVHGGDTVVQASSDYSLLSVYAAKRTNGTLALLVINKSPSSTLKASIALTNFHPKANATISSYGIPQDDAARTGTGSPDAASSSLSNASANFSATFAPYSASTLVLSPTLPNRALLPTADAYVRSGSYASRNFGAQSLLVVRKVTPSSSDLYNRAAYLKFDLTGLTEAPRSATLTLTVDLSSNPTAATETLNLYSVSETNWTETGLTWNNAPGLNRTNFSSAGTRIGTKTVALKPGTVTYDLTAFVASHLGQVVTLQLLDAAAENVYLALESREASSGKPTLSLFYGPVSPLPEPRVGSFAAGNGE